jgi:asparagine synthase (glutamine-hydrolysing)
MCGIAGEISWTGGADTRTLGQMSHGIRHRGPDDEGLWISEDKRCGLAFRRLSIIDLSPTGHQPMLDRLTGNVIVFNGEIYICGQTCANLTSAFEKRHSVRARHFEPASL